MIDDFICFDRLIVWSLGDNRMKDDVYSSHLTGTASLGLYTVVYVPRHVQQWKNPSQANPINLSTPMSHCWWRFFRLGFFLFSTQCPFQVAFYISSPENTTKLTKSEDIPVECWVKSFSPTPLLFSSCSFLWQLASHTCTVQTNIALDWHMILLVSIKKDKRKRGPLWLMRRGVI